MYNLNANQNMKLSPIILSSLFIMILCACHPLNGQQSETRKLGLFDAVHVGSGIDLFLHPSDEYKVVVQSNSDPEEIITTIENGVLIIHYERSFLNFKWNNNDEVHAYAPEFKEVRASGGSDVEGTGVLHTDFLRLSASGGSDIRLDIKANETKIECSGGSDAYLSGSSGIMTGNASGGSDIKAYEFIVDEAELVASGGSDIQVTVKEKLWGKASGGSDIYYKGNPSNVQVDSSSGSDIVDNN